MEEAVEVAVEVEREGGVDTVVIMRNVIRLISLYYRANITTAQVGSDVMSEADVNGATPKQPACLSYPIW